MICSAIGMNTQVVDHGVNGMLAQSADDWVRHLEELLGQPELRRRMGESGRRTYVQRFRREIIGDQWVRILRAEGRPSKTGDRMPAAQ